MNNNEDLLKKIEERERNNINLQQNYCVICFENFADSVLMKCGHGGLCIKCSIEFWKKKNHCYLCRNVYFIFFKNYIIFISQFPV